MKRDQIFSLEGLSKIAGAQQSEKVLSFFDTLDTYISNEELVQFEQEHANISKDDDTQQVNILREDKINEKENTHQAIIDNFPQKHDTALVVPKIV